MKPELSRFLEVASGHLLLRSAPALNEGYEQSSVSTLAILLGIAREELERGAARRVEENRALRALFAGALEVVTLAALRERLAAAAGAEDESLLLGDLERGNAELRGLLIELHAHVEELPGSAARDCEAAIWRELDTSTQRRRLSLAPF